MANWNIENIPSQEEKVAIITGANSGIGYETALALAKKRMTIVLACRNSEKGLKTENEIFKSFSEAQLVVMQVDLSSLTSIQQFSNEFRKV